MALSLKRIEKDSKTKERLPEKIEKNLSTKKRPWQRVNRFLPNKDVSDRRETYLLKLFRGSKKNTTKEFLLELIH